MSEVNQELNTLYNQYGKEVDTPKRGLNSFVHKIRKPSVDQHQAKIDAVRRQIVEVIRKQPGRHPLARISAYVGLGHDAGFNYGFNQPLGNDLFEINYWSYNRWGLSVQGHDTDYTPEIEVLDRENDLGLTLVHLPEGIQIPVGPLRFKSESTPMSTEESDEAKNEALRLAEKVRIKISRNMQNMIDTLPEGRKYTDRYFYWQPALPEKPARIAVDFDKLNPLHMGLSLDDAPVFSDILVVK